MAENILYDDLHVDRFAVITSTDETHAIRVRNLMLAHWDQISQQMKDCTLLFIGGVHGTDKGKIAGKTGSCITMANQVRNFIRSGRPSSVVKASSFATC